MRHEPPAADIIGSLKKGFSGYLESLDWLSTQAALNLSVEKAAVVEEDIGRARRMAELFEREHVRLWTRDLDTGELPDAAADYSIRVPVRLAVSYGQRPSVHGGRVLPFVRYSGTNASEIQHDENLISSLIVAICTARNCADWVLWRAKVDQGGPDGDGGCMLGEAAAEEIRLARWMQDAIGLLTGRVMLLFGFHANVCDWTPDDRIPDELIVLPLPA